MTRILLSLHLILFVAFGSTVAQDSRPEQATMSLDLKDTDIRDAIRMISKGYNLNIVLDKDVEGKITVHLSDVPIMEGLRTLAESHGFRVEKVGGLYRIRRKSDEGTSTIRYSNGKLTVDVRNVDVRDFLEELSSKTAVSIVFEDEVEGRISGKLFQVDLDHGLRTLLEGSGYAVVKRRGIYQVSLGAESKPAAPPRLGSKRRSRGTGEAFVEYESGTLTLEVVNGDLEKIIREIAERADVEIVTWEGLVGAVNAVLYEAPLTEALTLLLGGTKYTFVEKDGVILVGNRNTSTPSGQALSKSELIRLRHIKAEGVPSVLPQKMAANHIKVIKEQNAMVVTGTSEDIAAIRDFIEAIDIPTPQVRIDAIIVEYKDNVNRELGLRYWREQPGLFSDEDHYIDLPSPDTKYATSRTHTEIGISGKELKRLLGFTNGVLSQIPDEFFAALRMLESQDKAQVLAQPSVMTLNGNPATITVDETQYFKVATGVPENYTTRFQPIKFGITLNITPWISEGGQITAEISPQVSNSEQVNQEGYPNVSTRSLKTTVRLNDGETLVLGGLMKNRESDFTHRVPILGSLPIIGALFRYTGKKKSKTNLVIYITPHIISPVDTVALKERLKDYRMGTQSHAEYRALEMLDKALSPGSIQRLHREIRLRKLRRRNAADTSIAPMDTTDMSTGKNLDFKEAQEQLSSVLDTPQVSAPRHPPETDSIATVEEVRDSPGGAAEDERRNTNMAGERDSTRRCRQTPFFVRWLKRLKNRDENPEPDSR